MKYERSVNAEEISGHICYLPTGSTPTVQPKIEQSKIKAEVSGLYQSRYFCFLFSGFSLPVLSALCPLFSLCFQKREKAIKKEKLKRKHPETTYLQGKFKSKTNTNKMNLSLFLSLLWSCLKQWANAKPEKGAENKAKIIKSENLKMKKIPKISWKGKGYFRWDKRSVFNGTWT